MKYLRVALVWIKDNLVWILSSALFILGAGWYYREKSSFRDFQGIAQLQCQVNRTARLLQDLRKSDAVTEEEVHRIRLMRRDVVREIRKKRITLGLTDKEVLDAFKKLGY